MMMVVMMTTMMTMMMVFVCDMCVKAYVWHCEFVKVRDHFQELPLSFHHRLQGSDSVYQPHAVSAFLYWAIFEYMSHFVAQADFEPETFLPLPL